jgi:hypothetical protein
MHMNRSQNLHRPCAGVTVTQHDQANGALQHLAALRNTTPPLLSCTDATEHRYTATMTGNTSVEDELCCARCGGKGKSACKGCLLVVVRYSPANRGHHGFERADRFVIVLQKGLSDSTLASSQERLQISIDES